KSVTPSPGVSCAALVLSPSFGLGLGKATSTAFARPGNKAQYFGSGRARVVHKARLLMEHRHHHGNARTPFFLGAPGMVVPSGFIVKNIANVAFVSRWRRSTSH